jgi:hypothetical protein
MRVVLLAIANVVMLCACATTQSASPAPAATTAESSAPRLDWTAAWRWVHIDRIDPARIALFEDARRTWLATLGPPGRRRQDGRALFFSGRDGDAAIYYTLYPYATWSDLDARSAAAKATQQAVGTTAVQAYDAGDAALVPPHRSELWTHLDGSDVIVANEPALEPDARAIVIEYRRMPTAEAGAEFDRVWSRLQKALQERGDTATVRAYWSLYGSGELVLVWLAHDESMLAPSNDGLAKVGRSDGGAAMLADLERLAPRRTRLALTRRDDLSNLPER